MVVWSQIVKDKFPDDEDEFEESISLMKTRLEEIILDDSHKYRTQYFLTGYESAYKIINGWFNRIKAFENIYDEANKETYMELCILLDEDSDEIAKEETAFSLLEKSIPEELTKAETSLYAQLWYLKWMHDVVLKLRRYDDLFREGEYTEENRSQWWGDWVSYERLDLFSLCADVYEYLHLESSFQKGAWNYVNQFDIPRSFFALLEERKD